MKKRLTKDSFLRSFFIDEKPYWREERYARTLQSLKEAIILKDFNIEKIRTSLPAPSSLLQQMTVKSFEVLFGNDAPPRKQYGLFLDSLRKGLMSRQYQVAYAALLKSKKPGTSDEIAAVYLQELSLAFFTKISLQDFCAQLVQDIVEAGKPLIQSEPKTHVEEFPRIWEAIHLAPSTIKTSQLKRHLQALRGELNLAYDPHFQDNTPYLLHEHTIALTNGEIKKIPSLRIGTQTFQKVFSLFNRKAEVTPEFRAFLQAYQLSEKKHLYINLQDRRQRFHGITEASRCYAIEKLCKEFPHTFLIITLSKDTPFYWQSGPYEKIRRASLFKELLKKQLTSSRKGFFFSPLFVNNAFFPFDRTIDDLIEFTHETYFANNEILNRDERLDFIEIFYTLLIDHCLESTQVDTCNISCRDGIDRAGAANALLYLYRYMRTKANIDDLQLNQLKSILFAPAILVKKRAITQKRFERFMTAAKRIFRNGVINE